MKPLVSTEWLADNLGEVMVFDCTYYLPTEKRDAMAEFTAGHIPSAGFFDINAIADHDTDLPHMVPSPGRFARLIGELGISNTTRVVFYDQKGLNSAMTAPACSMVACPNGWPKAAASNQASPPRPNR